MSEVMLGMLDDIADGDHRVYAIGEFEFGVFRRGERLIAWENNCPHAGGPVCQGRIYRKVDEKLGPNKTSLGLKFSDTPQIVCPWHGFEFDLETGCHPADPNHRLHPVPVSVREGRIYVTPPK